MEVSKRHIDIFLEFDERRSIESNFIPAFESGYVALHPFYTSVFQPHFNYRGRLKDTFHLIEPVTWDKVTTELKFKNLNQLANALLETNKSDSRELDDFVEYKKLLLPLMVEDTIPEVILNKYLKHLIRQGIKEVISGYSKHNVLEEDRQHTSMEVGEKNAFEIIEQLQRRFVVTEAQMSIALLLPGHDYPYTLILGDGKNLHSFITDLSIEGFWVDKKTKFDWWNE